MSLLYKKSEDLTYSVDIHRMGISTVSNMKFTFSSDCGKHGTNECLAEYVLSPKDLLNILHENWLKNNNDAL